MRLRFEAEAVAELGEPGEVSLGGLAAAHERAELLLDALAPVPRAAMAVGNGDHGTLAGDERRVMTTYGKRRTTKRRTSRSGSVPRTRRPLCGRSAARSTALRTSATNRAP